ncbi:hypothetical protein CCR95_17825 [Thiocystis minor]|nr:hypothetical protein [Thiocystis minor]
MTMTDMTQETGDFSLALPSDGTLTELPAGYWSSAVDAAPEQNVDDHAAEDGESDDQDRIPEYSADGRRIIYCDYTKPNLTQMVTSVEDAVRTIPGKSEVLRHGGIHCYIAATSPRYFHAIGDVKTKAPSIPSLVPYEKAAMLLRIDQSATFMSNAKKKGWEPIEVPSKLVPLILDNPDSHFPETVGLVTHPLVLPNGELLIEEGLHTDSGIYVYFGGITFEAPGEMTPEEGVHILREEMLGEFEFATETDAAAALALVLTVIERKTLDMAPGFMINASTQGSGKTTLARMIHLLVTGHDLPVASMSENVAEQNKELTAMLIASVPIVCFDNIPDAHKISSPVLAKAITSPTHTGRILGFSKMAALPTNATFLITGNNITTDMDLSRRLLEVRLTSQDARPEQRRFTHPHVISHVLNHRTRWMQAALSILHGHREVEMEARPSGFHQWDEMVRWPLLRAGVTDPVTKFDDLREQSPDYEQMFSWMLGLIHGFGIGKAFRAQDLVRKGETSVTLQAASSHQESERLKEMYADYLSGHPPQKGWSNVNSIGISLKRLVGRNIDGYTLTTRKIHGTTHYSVEEKLALAS